MTSKTGRPVFVVGPSGAGKDSVLRGAAVALAGNEHYVFPRRLITRQSDTNSEDHDTITGAEFQTHVEAGNFMLHWQAHGLGYGIPLSVERDIEAGRVASINVSRNILQSAAVRFPDMIIVEITADPELRINRIETRGREISSDAATRALRETASYPTQVPLFRIENNAELETAVQAFVKMLKDL